GALTSTPTETAVATLPKLAITGAAGDRPLSFSATGLSLHDALPISLTAGTATQLTVTTEPSSTAQSGVPFAQQPVIQIRDASGKERKSTRVTSTQTIASYGVSFVGKLTATTTGTGAATFTNLAITGA